MQVQTFVYPKYNYDPDGLLDDIPIKDFFDADKIYKLGETDERLTQFAEAFANEKFAS